ncbi:MAG TPA: YceH family protein [Solirubrobacteraceae bacterium]
MDLSAAEIRVLGCLLEKQRTTPDHYPLSLNSLRLACNQATNREPVVDYDDAIVRDALHRLERRGYTRLAGASRAAKYRHLLSEALPMSSAEQAVMCVLMLRGPQTPGELKQRGERIHAFAGLDEVHETLAALIERDLVAQLGRRPGQKEDRYTQLLGESESANGNGAIEGSAVQTASPVPPRRSHDDLHDRVARLEREVAELRTALAERDDAGSTAVEHHDASSATAVEHHDASSAAAVEHNDARSAAAVDYNDAGSATAVAPPEVSAPDDRHSVEQPGWRETAPPA